MSPLRAILESMFTSASDAVAKLQTPASPASALSPNQLVQYGLEDEDGNIIRVTVPKDKSLEFADILRSNTGMNVAEILSIIKSSIDIIDVDWPEIVEDQAPQQQLTVGDSDNPPIQDDGEEGEGGDAIDDPASVDSEDEEANAPDADEDSTLSRLLDIMKSDAESRTAEANARRAEANRDEAQYILAQTEARVKQEEQIMSMKSQEMANKKEMKSIRDMAQLASYFADDDAEAEEPSPSQPISAKDIASRALAK